MTNFTRAAAALAAVACSISAASAADLGGPRRGSPKDEPVYVAPVYNWTGLYFGGYVGLAHGLWTVDFYRNNNHGHAEEGADGFAGGGWVGYNYQLPSNFVIGLEADLGATTASQSTDIFDNDTSYASYGMIGSLRGRAGYAMDRLMVYGTVGLAFANITNTIQKGRNAGEQVLWEDQTATGYTLGGGLEYAFSDRWVGRAEYLYADYGTVNLVNQDGNKADFGNELHLLRTGLSYRF
jgi:outer membrane immunogenic protein